MNPIKRRILMAVFAVGTIGGFASGIHHMRFACHRYASHRAAFEQHVAALCVDAAKHAESPAER